MGICLIINRLPNIFFSIDLCLFSFFHWRFLKFYVPAFFLMNKHTKIFECQVAKQKTHIGLESEIEKKTALYADKITRKSFFAHNPSS